MDKQNIVTLKVGGSQYTGWTDIRIETSIQSLCRGCTLGATRAAGAASLVAGIEEGASAEVLIGDDPLITGYIVGKTLSYSASDVSISILIKSKTVDLEECAVPCGKPHRWASSSLASVISELCGHYGVTAVTNGLGAQKTNRDVSSHETIGKSIRTLIKSGSMLVHDDGLGRLVLAKVGSAGTATDALEMGKNVLSGSRSADVSEIYSHYVVVGQGTDPKSTAENRNARYGKADNSGFSRERWSVTEQPGNRSTAELKARADNLMLHAIGDADTLTYKVQGWRQSDGSLWLPNSLIKVKDPLLDVEMTLVASRVSYSLSNSEGSTTSIELKAPDAFLVTELPDEDRATGAKAKKAGSKAQKGYSFLAKKDSGKI